MVIVCYYNNTKSINAETLNIANIGLGYVGLPLAVEFGKQFNTQGRDIHPGALPSHKPNRKTACNMRPLAEGIMVAIENNIL